MYRPIVHADLVGPHSPRSSLVWLSTTARGSDTFRSKSDPTDNEPFPLAIRLIEPIGTGVIPFLDYQSSQMEGRITREGEVGR